MKSALDLLNSYVSAFWSLVSSKIEDQSLDIKAILRLKCSEDFDFLIASRNIIQDASLAISHFQRFGLSGATKYDELGEKYLRLYGLLSATYAQQQAILKTYKIMHVGDPQKVKDGFDTLDTRSLRHKLVAHGMDYKVNDKPRAAYAPLRFELHDRQITYVGHNRLSHHETVDLSAAVEFHLKLMIDVLDAIFEKSIELFTKDRRRKSERNSRSNFTIYEIEKNGGLVFTPECGPKIIVTFIGGRTPVDALRPAIVQQ